MDRSGPPTLPEMLPARFMGRTRRAAGRSPTARAQFMALAAAAALLLAGCNVFTRPTISAAPSSLQWWAQFAAPTLAEAPVVDLNLLRPAHAAPRLAAGELLEITVWDLKEPGQPETFPVRVEPDQTVALPYVGSVPASGASLSELEADIAAAYREGEILKQPRVVVRSVDAEPIRVYVTGAVNRPGIVSLSRRDSSVYAALVAAGGLSKSAGTHLQISRRGSSPGPGPLEVPAAAGGPTADLLQGTPRQAIFSVLDDPDFDDAGEFSGEPEPFQAEALGEMTTRPPEIRRRRPQAAPTSARQASPAGLRSAGGAAPSAGERPSAGSENRDSSGFLLRNSVPDDPAGGVPTRTLPRGETGLPDIQPASRDGDRDEIGTPTSGSIRHAVSSGRTAPGHAGRRSSAAPPRTQPVEFADEGWGAGLEDDAWGSEPDRLEALPPTTGRSRTSDRPAARFRTSPRLDADPTSRPRSPAAVDWPAAPRSAPARRNPPVELDEEAMEEMGLLPALPPSSENPDIPLPGMPRPTQTSGRRVTAEERRSPARDVAPAADSSGAFIPERPVARTPTARRAPAEPAASMLWFDLSREADRQALTELVLDDGDVVTVRPAAPPIRIAGSVRQPGTYPLPAGRALNVVEVLELAGGVDDDGVPLQITLTRMLEDRTPRRWTYALGAGELPMNTEFVQPGDSVHVEKTTRGRIQHVFGGLLSRN